MKLFLRFGSLALVLFMILSQAALPAFAAGHGCSTNEPDRDEDGVPDKSDDFPDDPTRTGEEKKFCGPIEPEMKLYYVPFGVDTPSPVTSQSIESEYTNGIWVCSKNDTAGSIKQILDGGAGDDKESAPSSAAAPSAKTDSQEVPVDEESDSLNAGTEEDLVADFDMASGPDGGAEDLGNVDSEEIRLKIEVPETSSEKTIYLVDKNGEGVKNGLPFKLTEQQMSDIASKIQSLVQSTDPKVVNLELATAGESRSIQNMTGGI